MVALILFHRQTGEKVICTTFVEGHKIGILRTNEDGSAVNGAKEWVDKADYITSKPKHLTQGTVLVGAKHSSTMKAATNLPKTTHLRQPTHAYTLSYFEERYRRSGK